MNKMFGFGIRNAIQDNFNILQKEVKYLQRELEHEKKLRKKNQWKRKK